MAKPQSLVHRLLNTPDVAKVIPRLEPEVLHRVFERVGLEDCAELVALATPAQLERVLDADLWRAAAPGRDETFDAGRFAVWLGVLIDAGAGAAAAKLQGIDLDLVISGVSRHVRVFDHAAVAAFTTLDGNHIGGRLPDRSSEIGGYVIAARETAAAGAVVELLGSLAADHPEYFSRLMRGCVRLSSGAREDDGLHRLLDDRGQDDFDRTAEREARRDARGYVAAAQARAFVETARHVTLNGEQPARDPVSHAYLRELGRAVAAAIERDEPAREPSAESDSGAIAAVLEVLRDAGVIAPPRGLLAAGDADTASLALVRAHVESHDAAMEELAFLVNALLAGCSLQGRAFTPREASDAAAATCNLGLENWPARWPDRNLVAAFQVGWSLLHREVCRRTAATLIEVLDALSCADRDTQFELTVLRRELARHLREGLPWRARHALDVILALDAPAWAALVALIDECPTLHAAIGSPRSSHTIEANDFSFISHRGQIATVHGFLSSLSVALTG